MRSIGKFSRLAFCLTLLLAAAGCSGINASKSISPLDFFLPGLIQATPQPAQPDGVLPTDTFVKQIAQL